MRVIVTRNLGNRVRHSHQAVLLRRFCCSLQRSLVHPRPQSLQSIWSAGRLSALVTVTTGCREIHDIQLRMSIKINFYCACSVLEKLTTRNEGFCEEIHPKLMATPKSKGRWLSCFLVLRGPRRAVTLRNEDNCLSQQSQRLTRIVLKYFKSTSVVTFGFDEVHDHVELVCFGFSWFVNYLR